MKIALKIALLSTIMVFFVLLANLSSTKNTEADTNNSSSSDATATSVRAAKTLPSAWIESLNTSKLESIQTVIFLKDQYDVILSELELTVDFSTPDYTDSVGLEYYFADDSAKLDNALIIYNDTGGDIYAPANSKTLFYGDRIIAGSTRNLLGAVEYIYFNSVFKVTTATTTMHSMFKGLDKLKLFDSFTGWNTSRVTNFEQTFAYTTALKMLDLRSFNTSSATTMASMFQGAKSLSYLNLTSFNTNMVASYNNMFIDVAVAGYGELHVLDLSSFSINKVTASYNVRMFRLGGDTVNQKIASIITPSYIGSFHEPIWVPKTDGYGLPYENEYYPYQNGVYISRSRRGSFNDYDGFTVGKQTPEHIFVRNQYNIYKDMQDKVDKYEDLLNNKDFTAAGKVELDEALTGGGSLDDLTNVKPAVAVTFWSSNFPDSNRVVYHTMKVTPGTVISPPSDPERPSYAPNYAFGYWVTMISGQPVRYNFANAISTTTDFFVSWVNATNTLTFNANTGTLAGGATIAEKEVNYNQITTPLTATKTGHTLAGWYTNSAGTGTPFNFATTPVTRDMTLYAKWTANNYTIIFNGNSATGGSMSNQVLTFGITTNLTLNSYTRPGYTFKGWTIDKDGTGSLFTDGKSVRDLTGIPNGTITFFAQWTPNNYSIEFEGNGATGGSMSDQVLTFGITTNLSLNKFKKTGHTFKGWTIDQEGSGSLFTDGKSVRDLTGIANRVITFYAQWTPNNYTVKFLGNGNTGGSMADQVLTFGTPANLTANAFTKTGHTFVGWTVAQDGSGLVHGNGEEVRDLTGVANGTITFHAQWRANTYTIKFDANGGSGSMADLPMTFGEAENLTLNSFSRTDYIFGGWIVKASSSGRVYTDGELVNNLTGIDGGEIVFSAVWLNGVFQVTFIGNDGLFPLPDGTYAARLEERVNVGATITAPTTVYKGYTLTRWNTEANGEGTDFDFSTPITANITLYAQWTPNNFTVVFNGNDHTGGETMANQSMTVYTDYVLSKNKFTRTGYTFSGWTIARDGSGTVIADEATVRNLTFEPNYNLNLYAKWTVNSYTVAFDGNDHTGGETMPSQTITYGSTVLLTSNAFTRPGYTFVKWNTASNGSGDNYSNGQSVTNLTATNGATITLYAIWQANTYQIIFDANDGAGSMGNQTMTYGSPVVALTSNTFTRTGYTFTGWNTMADGSGTGYSNGQTVNNLTTDSSITLFAIWQAITYVIEFDGNTGTGGPMADLSMTYDVSKTLTTNAFTKTGFDFVGWNTMADGSGTTYTNEQSVSNLTTTNGTRITLYAIWSQNNYTVIFNANIPGSTETTTQLIPFDRATKLAANGFSNLGHTFAGWNTLDNGNGTSYSDEQAVTNLATVGSPTITLYAIWQANTYTVIFKGNGATSGNMNSQTMTFGVSYNLSSNQFIKTGYTFKGWTIAQNGSGTLFTDGQQVVSLTSVPGNTQTFHAQWTANTYTIEFDGNDHTGGETMADQTFTYDSPEVALTLNIFTRPGYTFLRWNTSAGGNGTSFVNGQSIRNLTTIANDTITIYAIWQAINYEVEFDANGGSGNMPSQQMTYGISEALDANTFMRTGYIFVKWNTMDDGAGTDYTDELTVSNLTTTNGATITLYAIWEAITYEIEFDSNSGSGGPMANLEMTYDLSKALTTNVFTRPGYTFLKWNTTSNNTGTSYSNEQSVSNLTTTDGATITLYAIWQAISYQVIFDANDGDGSMSNQTMTYDSSLVALTSNTFARTGYTFKGWNTVAGGSGTAYTDGQLVNNLTTNSTIVLYAIWEAITYTVQFDSNDGSSTVSTQEMTYGTTVALNSNAFTRPGYTFLRWNTEAGGLGTDYADGASVSNLTATNGATITLYAIWEANTYEVIFNANDGSGSMDNQDMIYGSPVEALTPNAFTRPGYTFLKWNTQADGEGTSYTNGQEVNNLTTNSSITLYAIWQANTYEVIFNANDGAGHMPNQEMVYGISEALDLNTFTRTGYTFTGWNTVDSGSGTDYTDGFTVSNLTTDGTITLYAIWEANTYEVVFNANNGAGNMLSQTMTYDSALVALTLNAFTRTGHTFAGWNTDPEGNGTSYTDGQLVNNLATDGTIVLYAIWNIKSQTVIFMNDVTEYSKADIVYGSTATKPATDPTKTGYTFAGWVKTNGGTDAFDFNSAITEDITLYASWTINTYTESFINGSGSTLDSNDALTHGSTYTVTVTLRTLVTLDSIIITMNGTTLVEGTDYTVSGNVYTLTITGNIVVETKTTDQREAAKEELEDYYEDLKDKYPNLDDETLGELEDALNEALDKVENATTEDELDKEVEAGKDAMDDVILEDAKDDAKEELEDYYEDLLEKNPNLSDEEKQDLEDAKDEALGNVDNATTPEDAAGAVQPGKDAMDDVILDTEKEDAKEELEDYYEDLLEKNPGLSDEDKQELEDALNDAKDKVDNATSKDDVDKEVQAGKDAMDKVIFNAWDIWPLIITIIIMMIIILITAVVAKKIQNRRILRG